MEEQSKITDLSERFGSAWGKVEHKLNAPERGRKGSVARGAHLRSITSNNDGLRDTIDPPRATAAHSPLVHRHSIDSKSWIKRTYENGRERDERGWGRTDAQKWEDSYTVPDLAERFGSAWCTLVVIERCGVRCKQTFPVRIGPEQCVGYDLFLVRTIVGWERLGASTSSGHGIPREFFFSQLKNECG
ncbi:hypothetical protein C8R44DRAFT_724929 [Mycena epipterygia]|nr:hypothetical protein C8R44DRAFT_724929 [Mycena epipterygia]